ncbi:probable vacuolar protein 8 at C-terminar half [Coccomyxa sp. Obi]|nr:probable vacuolar protein 8 at C-terminar half [Coccomyxa sp. Obi]
MAISNQRSEDSSSDVCSGSGTRTPRQLRLRSSPPKKSSPKRTSPHKDTHKSSGSSSPRGSSLLPDAQTKPDSQPAILCPVVIKLEYRMCPVTPPRRVLPLPPASPKQHSPRLSSPRQKSSRTNSPKLVRIQQQQQPEGLTTWPPLPAFELLVPHVLPYPPVQKASPPEPRTPVRMLSPPADQPWTPDRYSSGGSAPSSPLVDRSDSSLTRSPCSSVGTLRSAMSRNPGTIWLQTPTMRRLSAGAHKLAARLVADAPLEEKRVVMCKLHSLLFGGISEGNRAAAEKSERPGVFVGILRAGLGPFLQQAAGLLLTRSESTKVPKATCLLLKALAEWIAAQLEPRANPTARAIIAAELRALVDIPPIPAEDAAAAQSPGGPSQRVHDSPMDMEAAAQRFVPSIPSVDSIGNNVGSLGSLLPLHRASYTEARVAFSLIIGAIAAACAPECEEFPSGVFVKPLVRLVRHSKVNMQASAAWGLNRLIAHAPARGALAQNDKHLGVLAGLLQGDSPVGVRSSVANIVRRLIADDHSTQWVLAEAGAVEGLVHLLEAPAAQPRALADAVFALKRLTAADRRSRAAFVAAAGPDALLRLLDSQQHQLVAPVPSFPLLDTMAARAGSTGLPPRSPMGRPPRSPLGSVQDLQQLPSRGSPSRRGAASEAGGASQACTPERPRPAASAAGTPPRESPAGSASGEYGPQMQYSAARILRHLALDGDAGHKTAARTCLPALVQALKEAKPRVAFALASAISAAVEGSPDAAQLVADSGGIALLVRIMRHGSGHGKKAAAEALQVLRLCPVLSPAITNVIAGLMAMAAESEVLRPALVAAGAVTILTDLLVSGNVQQRAACIGALQALAFCPQEGTRTAEGIASGGCLPHLLGLLRAGPLPLRSLAAGALCNLTLGNRAIAADVAEAGAVASLVELVRCAQADGQYAAAAALYNMAAAHPELRPALAAAGAVKALVALLKAESWYCRIIAADVLACLATHEVLAGVVADSQALQPLVDLLHLQHSPGMLEAVTGPVQCLSYERGRNEILMRGYKFAAAKLTATAALGCIASANSESWRLAESAGLALLDLLNSANNRARALAAAALADVSTTDPETRTWLCKMASRNGRALVEAAGKEQRATAALLRRQREACPYSGYAIIAKCSASLQSELQVPFNTDINSKQRDSALPSARGFLPTPRVMELDTWRTTIDCTPRIE